MCSASLLVQLLCFGSNRPRQGSDLPASAVHTAVMTGSLANSMWFQRAVARAQKEGLVPRSVRNENDTWYCPACAVDNIWLGYLNDHLQSTRHKRILNWAAANDDLEAERASGNMPWWKDVKTEGLYSYTWCNACGKCATDAHCRSAAHMWWISQPQDPPAVMDMERQPVSDEMVHPPLPGGLGFRVWG